MVLFGIFLLIIFFVLSFLPIFYLNKILKTQAYTDIFWIPGDDPEKEGTYFVLLVDNKIKIATYSKNEWIYRGKYKIPKSSVHSYSPYNYDLEAK